MAPPAISSFRRTMQRRPVIGTFIKLANRAGIDLAHEVGFDFVVIDREHSALDERDALDLVANAALLGLPAIVRLPAVDPGAINRLLENGASGIQISTIRTRDQVEQLRSATRYSPDGSRSISLAHPTASYGLRPLADYVEGAAADQPLLIGQIETRSTDDPLDEIVELLDIAFIGTTDLVVDMGLVRRPDDPEVDEKVTSICDTTVAAGRVAGCFAGTAKDIPALLARGVRYIVVGSDVNSLARAMADSASAASALATAPDQLDPDSLEG